MIFERCTRCTAPIYVRLAAVWNDDGTITGRFASHTRVVQIYADEINAVLDGISSRIGFDIGHVVAEGERKAGLDFTSDLMRRSRGLTRIIVRSGFLSRLLFGFVLRAARNAGLGDGRLLEYERCRRMVIEFASPFNLPILAGDILGAFEAFFGVPGEVGWKVEGGRATVTVEAAPGLERSGERLRPILPPTVPGYVNYHRCPRCRMPFEVTRRYRFDLKAGIATEVMTGRRIVTVIIDSLNAVFRELEEELGPEVPSMIAAEECGFLMGVLDAEGLEPGEQAVWRLLDDLTVKGMGNPTKVSVDGEALEVRIDNPFSEELLAGRVLACYRLLWGEPAEVSWTPDTEGFMFVNVDRKDSS